MVTEDSLVNVKDLLVNVKMLGNAQSHLGAAKNKKGSEHAGTQIQMNAKKPTTGGNDQYAICT